MYLCGCKVNVKWFVNLAYLFVLYIRLNKLRCIYLLVTRKQSVILDFPGSAKYGRFLSSSQQLILKNNKEKKKINQKAKKKIEICKKCLKIVSTEDSQFPERSSLSFMVEIDLKIQSLFCCQRG